MQKQFVLLFVLALFAELATVFSQSGAENMIGSAENIESNNATEGNEHFEHHMEKPSLNMNCDGLQEKCSEACQNQLPELFRCHEHEGYECICRKWALSCLTIANCGVVTIDNRQYS